MREESFQKLLDFKFYLRRRCHFIQGEEREFIERMVKRLEEMLGQENHRERYLRLRKSHLNDFVG